MEINQERLKSNLIKIGEIGKNEKGGITRLAFSSEYYQAAAELKTLMEQAGLEVTQDELGTVFGKREGEDNSLPSLMIGSHLDTVRNGGLLDGTLGVMAALECINVLNEKGIKTRFPLEIAAFNAEEGSEMGGTFCSRVMVGMQDPADETLPDKLKEYDLTVADVEDAVRDIEEIRAFLELHIEQGEVLEHEQLPIGIVNGIAGITRYRITVKGEANHAGTTPMNLRNDALTTAAKLITDIEEIANTFADPFVATVGKLNVHPGSVNVIPGKVEFVLELRDLDQDKIDLSLEKFEEAGHKYDNADITFEEMINKPPVDTDESITDIIEKACLESDIKYRHMASGAGHDAKEIARKIPTGMIFVPSKNGKSHCPEEWTDWEDIYQGVEVMLNTILLMDQNL